MGEIWEIHHATHGPGFNRERVYGACARAMVEKLRTLYLWKEKPEDSGYKESWEDPRKPRKNLWQDRAQERDETPVIKRSRGRGL